MNIVHLMVDVFEFKKTAFQPKKTILGGADAFIVLPEQRITVNLLEYAFIPNKRGEMRSYLDVSVDPVTTFFDTGFGQYIGAEESENELRTYKPRYSLYSDDDMHLNSFEEMLLLYFNPSKYLTSFVIEHNTELRSIYEHDRNDLISVEVNCAKHRESEDLSAIFSRVLLKELDLLMKEDVQVLIDRNNKVF